MTEFEQDIATNREPKPGLAEARTTMQIVEKIYAGSGY